MARGHRGPSADSNSDTRPRRISTRVLKEVTIPVMAKSAPSAAGDNKSSSATPSNLSSPNSSLLTDAQTTPNTSLGASPEPIDKPLPSGLSKKRKRSDSIDEPTAQIDRDAALALSLQDQAWNEDGSDNDASEVKDEIAGSDSDALSDLSEASSLSVPLAKARRDGKGRAPRSGSTRAGPPASKRQKLVKSDPDLGAGNSDEDSHDSDTYETKLSKARAGKQKAASLATTRRGRKAGIAARRSIGAARRDSNASTSSTLSDADSILSSVPSDGEYQPFSPGPVKQDPDSTDIAMVDPTDEDDDDEDDVPLSTTFAARRGQQALANTNLFEDSLLLLSRKDRERKKLEKQHPYIKTMWADLEAVPVIKPVQAVQPPSINRQLKSFQLEGLDWMMRQEQTPYKGGLLGDEMGMGKTIQAVSLIMSDYPAKQPTLVVVPPVALMQWSNEIADYTDGKLKIFVFHGQNTKTKGIQVSALLKFDVIMISYNTLESLHRKETKGWTRGEDLVKAASPIHAIHFHRLILDEAHSIKSRTTGVAKACFALKSNFRWCLSGTPVQNRIGEFFSLLRFLEVTPFANYLCKKCPCSDAHWNIDSATHKCKSCKHHGFQHVSVFNQELLNPITQPDHPSEREAAMDRLSLLTSRIMLRRMKRDYVSSMELPPKEVIIHNEFFGEVERDFSSSIMSDTTRKFDTYVSHGVMLNNYANIFGLIMQMRQVANHPDLILKKHAHEDQQNVLVCHICDEPAEDAIKSACKHEFCRSCVKTFMQSTEESGGDVDCPRCHIPLAIDLDQPEIVQDEQFVKTSSIINRINMQNWTSSTKIEMLVYDLYKLRSKKQTLKSIIFSQFTSMLQLIEWRLRRAGFTTVMLDGTMTPNQRQSSINHFMTDPNCEIFLVSLKAGGVALNLTEASRVFIVDPWWNPAAEWQSADRCHRIGQKRPCVITRLCIEDSVESRIVMLQEKKANMISGTINNDKVAMEKLTPEDMQFLFRGT